MLAEGFREISSECVKVYAKEVHLKPAYGELYIATQQKANSRGTKTKGHSS